MQSTDPNEKVNRRWRIVFVLGAIIAMFLLYSQSGPGSSDALVVYCAHDSVYSQQVLDAFTKQTGIAVEIRFDTEASKSLGLIEQIVAEANNPRCDVFWNNEQLGMMRLAEEGLLVPYQGDGYVRIPDAFKDAAGHWTGFGGRLRVWIVNTERIEPTQEAVRELHESDDLSRMAIAKPLWGTTRTHYTVLWHAIGAERTKQWHASLHDRGIVEASGNAMVKNLVAAGTCTIGLTDIDDYFVAKDAGEPVAALPFLLDTGEESPRSILIPNTVGIIRGTQQMENAKKLVEFLTSAENEIRLARSASRQIPLGPVDESQLTDDVRLLQQWITNPYPLRDLQDARQQCLQWLRQEYLR